MNTTANPTTPPEPQAGATPDLAAIQARCDAATPGPMRVEFGEHSGYDCMWSAHLVRKPEFGGQTIATLESIERTHAEDPKQKANAEFIAHAYTDIPALLAALATSRAETEEALKKQPINTSLRLFDLVRYMRSELHQKELVTDEEYAELCIGPMAIDRKNGGSPSPRRLEEYDALRAQLATLTATLAQREAEADTLRVLAEERRKEIAAHGSHGWIEIQKTCGRQAERIKDLEDDEAIVDFLATYWNSQGKGHHLAGHWFPNVNGSFRSAIHSEKESIAAARAAGTGEEGAGV